MATGPSTQISDVVVPEIFTGYVQQLTEQKARLIQSGAIVSSPILDEKLAGGGLTFNVPSWRDLDNDDENISTDAVSDQIAFSNTTFNGADVAGINAQLNGLTNDSVPLKTQSDAEVAVRMTRNNSWSSAKLAGLLAGDDPMASIASRVSYYWQRRLQAAFIAMMNGVIADNANDSDDYTNDISGASFSDGVTNFSTSAFIDATVTMGDSMEDLKMIMVHSIVYSRMQKNQLIDFIPDARGETMIPTFQGREVIVDDNVPNASGVYDTWLFGPGAIQFGSGQPDVPTEIQRKPSAGNGGGQEVLYNRVVWCLHPTGHAYTGTAPDGGPGNGTGSNMLANAGSWNRVYPERKQIKFARLVTREHA